MGKRKIYRVPLHDWLREIKFLYPGNNLIPTLTIISLLNLASDSILNGYLNRLDCNQILLDVQMGMKEIGIDVDSIGYNDRVFEAWEEIKDIVSNIYLDPNANLMTLSIEGWSGSHVVLGVDVYRGEMS